jgi:hypothetical protein
MHIHRNPPSSFDALDSEVDTVWRPLMSALEPWLASTTGLFRIHYERWQAAHDGRALENLLEAQQLHHQATVVSASTSAIALTASTPSSGTVLPAPWDTEEVMHNRTLLRLLFNLMHFFSWRIQNTKLLLAIQPDLVHVLVYSTFHPGYSCLDMSRVVLGLLNTASLSDDKVNLPSFMCMCVD